MTNISYQNAVWTIIFDENNRMPLWIVDDIIINPDNLKVEALIIKSSLFKNSKIINTSSIKSWWKNIYVSSYSLKEIENSIVAKMILEKEIWIIWNKVKDESWKIIWTVTNFFFNKRTFQWISILVKCSFLWLFSFWKWREIWKKDILDIKKENIIVRNLKLVKA